MAAPHERLAVWIRTPRASGGATLSAEELAEIAGITLRMLSRLVRLGLVEPLPSDRLRYDHAAAHRLRRMLRLRADLGVNLTGAAIIVDLLDRLARERDAVRTGEGAREPWTQTD